MEGPQSSSRKGGKGKKKKSLCKEGKEKGRKVRGNQRTLKREEKREKGEKTLRKKRKGGGTARSIPFLFLLRFHPERKEKGGKTGKEKRKGGKQEAATFPLIY